MKLFLLFAASVALSINDGVDALNVKIPGVVYTSRKGLTGTDDSMNCKSATEVQNDMNSIKTVADRVRITSLVDCNQGELVLSAAQAAGLQVHLGLSTAKDDNVFQTEKTKLASLIDSNHFGDHVIAVSVGSGSVSQGQVSMDTSLTYIKSIRDDLRSRGKMTPVSTAEHVYTYDGNVQLIEAVDFVSAISNTYWEKAWVNEAVALTIDQIRSVRASAKNHNKKFELAETTWSSFGQDSSAADSTPENQAKFFSELYQAMSVRSIDWYWNGAFDTMWREKEVEKHFGLFNETNALKSNFEGLTITPKKLFYIHHIRWNFMITEYGKDVFVRGKSNDPFDQEDQWWYYDETLQQYRSPTMRCLDAYQSGNGGDVHVYTCIDTEGNQKWKWDEATMLFRHLTRLDMCLNTDQAMAFALTMWPCSQGNSNQEWDLIPV
ncbi:ricin b lectin-like protein [Plasmopara halstedii]|uniref:glucan endo-1,3-beta-D-glucosidase n=1 Tax=Plasmopara halstedii TaxID=4781 RepID=A0A0P1A6V9_PLAHL|nr:ricin b lectin-like protein [Plasmopara halstedii]CEG35975.1 ricin b lectin-like protein [Plasmopara halstedii]|eukprot:XP_024572344.1 ricin b lectin-like protein [Plasmopara halstedii]